MGANRDMYQGIPEKVKMIGVDGCGNDLGLKTIGIEVVSQMPILYKKMPSVIKI